ncbi:MAG: DMT family transporter [Candidimonas sp.]|nr:MAG: DMT family transporter [Candidimonas sp.]TAM25415.1 MAG: DMT family transporter [Candidimonas sp.]
MSLVGSYVALSKPLAMVFPVFLLAWLRFGIGGIAMLRWIRKPAAEPKMTSQTRKLVFLESFLGNFLYTLCMVYGVSLSTAVSAGVIMSAIPAVIALMSWAFLREKVGRHVWAAVACGALGIGLLAFAKPGGAALAVQHLGLGGAPEKIWLGNLLLFGAVLCDASYVVLGKKLTTVLSPKRISAIINLWGFVLIMPMGAYVALHFDFTEVSVGAWALLLFYGMAASVWTVWLWMTGLKSIPAAQAGVFSVMLPIAAAIVGVLILGERLATAQMLALAVALMGLVLATLPAKRRRTKRALSHSKPYSN